MIKLLCILAISVCLSACEKADEKFANIHDNNVRKTNDYNFISQKEFSYIYRIDFYIKRKPLPINGNVSINSFSIIIPGSKIINISPEISENIFIPAFFDDDFIVNIDKQTIKNDIEPDSVKNNQFASFIVLSNEAEIEKIMNIEFDCSYSLDTSEGIIKEDIYYNIPIKELQSQLTDIESDKIFSFHYRIISESSATDLSQSSINANKREKNRERL